MFKRLIGSKTFWGSLAGICTEVGLLVSGEVTLQVGLPIIFGFLIAMFIRDTVAKVASK